MHSVVSTWSISPVHKLCRLDGLKTKTFLTIYDLYLRESPETPLGGCNILLGKDFSTITSPLCKHTMSFSDVEGFNSLGKVATPIYVDVGRN